MSIAERTARTLWEGPLASGEGSLSQVTSGALNGQQMSWASRTEGPSGKTSPEELAAAAHSSCFAMALALKLGENHTPPQRIDVTATVTLAAVDGIPTITTSRLDIKAQVAGLDAETFGRVVDQAAALCPVSRLFAGAEINVHAALDKAESCRPAESRGGTSMPGPTISGALESEHREIDTAIEQFIDELDDGLVKPELLTSALEELRRHIYIEEVLLFPAIPDGLPVLAIGVMLREHGELWRITDTLRDLLADGKDFRRLADTCAELLERLQQHNSKEEPVIYPQADKNLAPQTTAELVRFIESGRTPDGWVCRSLQV